NDRRAEEQRRIDPLANLLLHRLLLRSWPAEVVADADASDVQTVLQTRLLDLFQVASLQRLERAHVEIDAVEPELGTQIDEAEIIQLAGCKLGPKAQRETT